MAGWSATELASIDGVDELHVAAHRPDGSLRTARIIWHVVVDGHLFIPDDTHDDAIDQAYRAKYGSGSAVDHITSPTARTTTLRVERRCPSPTATAS